MAAANTILRKYLLDPQTQQVHLIAEGMPSRNQMVAGVQPPGKAYMPLQKIGLARALIEKTIDELSVGLGADFRVLRYGPKAYSKSPTSYNVTVISFYDLGRLHRKYKNPVAVRDMVAYILVDEGQHLSNSEATWMGQFLIALRTHSFWLFCGSRLVNGLADLGGYLALRFSAVNGRMSRTTTGRRKVARTRTSANARHRQIAIRRTAPAMPEEPTHVAFITNGN
ncbi:hypothetical protein LTR17_022818 [Elasticomyces elasticus]|nr:hypothetical protein LTR17_022818 [Elasticomyces elasticus]